MAKYLTLILLLISSGCTHNGPRQPIVNVQVEFIGAGGRPFASSQNNEDSNEVGNFAAPENGLSVIYTKILPDQNNLTDMSGIQKVFIYIPERIIDAASATKAIRVNETDGLYAKKLERNGRYTEDACIQALTSGFVILTLNNENDLTIESHLESPKVSQSSDAKCDASKFDDVITILRQTKKRVGPSKGWTSDRSIRPPFPGFS